MTTGIILSLIIGLLIGSVFGVITTAIITVGKKADEQLEAMTFAYSLYNLPNVNHKDEDKTNN